MRENKNIKKIFLNQKFLFQILLLLSSGIVFGNSYAEEILNISSSSSVEPTSLSLVNERSESINTNINSFEETVIIEFTNDGKKDVNSIRIWLDEGFVFKSFKTESGWSGEKTAQRVIVLTPSQFLKPGESVKIGIKTDIPNPSINWKALDNNKKEIGTGQINPKELSEHNSTAKKSNLGVLDNSAFRIIPEKPNAGSTIRVTGNNFGQLQQFEFYIDTNKIGTFQTDDRGFFMTTMKIPENQSQERSDFIVKDLEGNERKISIRIGTLGTKIPTSDNIQLTIKGIPEIMQIGDLLEISGTAKPNSSVTGTIKNPDGKIINTRTASADAKGNWNLSEPILVPLDSELGRYSAEITDGREKISKSWAIESSKVITIAPLKIRFAPGETLKFNGTALPNFPLEFSLEDPLGVEKLSKIIQVSDSGVVNFEYPTIANVDKEGTWTLIAVQENNREFIYAGLGELPSIPINIEFDKQSYKSTETAIISLTGKPGDTISMLIVDPADKPKGTAIPIKFKESGKTAYPLPLKGYSSGIYTAIISKGNSKSTEIFAVGLQTGSGEIKISTTKLEYAPNDPILILGEANKNVIITFSLIDPDGKKIKEIESFTDKNGKISEDGFRIPSESKPGKWKINAKSGSNYKTIEITVNASKEEGLVVSVDGGIKKSVTLGRYIDIKVINAAHTVELLILGPDGEIVAELSFPASSTGEVKLPWAIPAGLIPGNYTLTAIDGHNFSETIFLVK